MVLLQETYRSVLYNSDIPQCLIASFLSAVLSLVLSYVCSSEQSCLDPFSSPIARGYSTAL